MRLGRRWILVLALLAGLAGTAVVGAQERPEEGDGPVPERPARDEAPEPAPSGPPSDEDFVPSERIPADASIAFPVDI